MYRLLYLCYRGLSNGRYWVMRRFTPAGLAVLGAMAVAGGIGVDTSANVAHQAFALLLALLLVAIAGSVRFRGKFAVDRLLPRFGTVGTTLAYSVLVANTGHKTQRGLLVMENLIDPRPSLEEFTAQFRAEDSRTRSFRVGQRMRKPPSRMARIRPRSLPSLPPGSSGEVRLECLPLRRGLLRFTAVTVARPDPLGLFQGLRNLPKPQTVLILPKRYALPPIALPGVMKYQPGGVAQASSVGQSEEFVSLRPYRSGDPLRRIHWPSWAKAGEPVVKEFQDEFFVRHALVLDTFLDAPESDLFEEAVSVAASFACAIQTQESLLDLMFVGPQAICLTAGRGVAHVEQMLEILAAARPCRDRSFETLCQLVLDHMSLVSGCILVLVRWDEARRDLVRRLRAMGVPLVVLMIVEPAAKDVLANSDAGDRPERFHVLETGKIQEGLARL